MTKLSPQLCLTGAQKATPPQGPTRPWVELPTGCPRGEVRINGICAVPPIIGPQRPILVIPTGCPFGQVKVNDVCVVPRFIGPCPQGQMATAQGCVPPFIGPRPATTQIVVVLCDQETIPDLDVAADPALVVALVAHKIVMLCR